MGSVIFTVLDVLNLLIVLLLWMYTFRMYKKLPKKIPTHFDFEGKPDHFGKKKMAFLLPILSTVFLVAFFLITKNPEIGNFPVEITDSNSSTQFFIMILILKWLLFLVSLLFLNLQDYISRYSIDSQSKARFHILLFIPIIFVSVMTAIIAAYVYK